MENPFSLKNKNVLITGASSGIGKMCAIQANNLGANIILLGRNEFRLNKICSDLKGDNNAYYSLDLTDYNRLESVISESALKYGKITSFIHSAGIEKTIPLKITKKHHYEEMFSINVFSAFEIAKILSKSKYISGQGSSFVFISSVMGICGSPALTAYSATKGALIAATKSMALELANKNIRVNCISPGHVEGTAMSNDLFNSLPEHAKHDIKNAHPLGLGNTIDVANAASFLISDAAKWITGTNMIVDGGYSAK